MAALAVGHNPWYIALVIYNIITLIAVTVFCALSNFGSSGGLFISTQQEQSKKFPLDITPGDWTYYIWFVIYAWQTVWIVYGLTNLFRKTAFNEPLYARPYLLPPSLFGVYVIANGGVMAWFLLFDRGYIEGALAAVFLTSLLLTISLGVSYVSLDEGWVHLLRQRRDFDTWLVRAAVHNGLAIYASWTCVVTTLNLGIVIAYTKGSDVSVMTSSMIALGVLALEIGVFVLVDVCLLDHYSRYTLTPYVVLAVSLLGVLLHSWEPGSRNSVFSAVLCAVSCAALVVKIIVMITRHVMEGSGGD